MAEQYTHKPIMVNEIMSFFPGGSNLTVVDCTAGEGGHSREFASVMTDGKLVLVDRDEEMLSISRKRISDLVIETGNKVKLYASENNFANLNDVLDEFDIGGVDFILCDLGISMYHYKESKRGFSFEDNDSLDMRLDKGIAITASDIVNTYEEEAIRKIIFAYGEENRARQIARNIVWERKKQAIQSAYHLQKVISKAFPPKKHGEKINPATKTFQALRIYVNQEFSHLEHGLIAGIERLRPGGRLGVISFHSLEDRLVKRIFRYFSSECVCPTEFPVCQCSGYPVIKSLTKKPIEPKISEKESNPSSRSAKLRVVEKLYETKKDTWETFKSSYQRSREVSRSQNILSDSTYHKSGLIHGVAKH